MKSRMELGGCDEIDMRREYYGPTVPFDKDLAIDQALASSDPVGKLARLVSFEDITLEEARYAYWLHCGRSYDADLEEA